MTLARLVTHLSRFIAEPDGVSRPLAIGLNVGAARFGPSLLELTMCFPPQAVVVPLRCSPIKQPAADLIWQALDLAGTTPVVETSEPISIGVLERAIFGHGRAGAASEQLSWFLQAKSHGEPIILLIEDVHWASDAELKFLGTFLQTEAGSRAAVVYSHSDAIRARQVQRFEGLLGKRRLRTLCYDGEPERTPPFLSTAQITALVATRLYGKALPAASMMRLIGYNPRGEAGLLAGLQHVRLHGEDLITFRDGYWAAYAQRLTAEHRALARLVATKLLRTEGGAPSLAMLHRKVYWAAVAGDLSKAVAALQALMGAGTPADPHLLATVLRRVAAQAHACGEGGLAALAWCGLGLARLELGCAPFATVERRLLRDGAALVRPGDRWILHRRLGYWLARSKEPAALPRAKVHLRAALDEIAAVVSRTEREQGIATLKSGLAMICYRSRQFAEGLRYEQQAVGHLESLPGTEPSQLLLINSLLRMGNVCHRRLGEHARAREFYTRALSHALGAERPADVYRCYKLLALAAMDLGNYREALGHWNHAELSLIDSAGNWSLARDWEREKAEAHQRMAESHLRLGRLTEAAAQYTMLVTHFQHRLPAWRVAAFQANVELCYSRSIS